LVLNQFYYWIHGLAIDPDVIAKNRPVSVQDFALLTIPAGTTDQKQPLDVYGFRSWKNFIKYFSDIVMLLDLEVKLKRFYF